MAASQQPPRKKQASLLSFFTKQPSSSGGRGRGGGGDSSYSTSSTSSPALPQKKLGKKLNGGRCNENDENFILDHSDTNGIGMDCSEVDVERKKDVLDEDDEISALEDEDTSNKRGSKKRKRVLIDSDSEDDTRINPQGIKTNDISLKAALDDDDDLEDLANLKEKFGIKAKGKSGGKKEELVTSTPIRKGSGTGISEMTKSFLSSFQADDSVSYSSFNMDESISSAVVTSDKGRFDHLSLDFLKPEQLRDGNKNRPSHPDYDGRTLYVPESYYRTVTPGIQQWWKIKSQHFDTILFFKVGKFYEMYHMDAVVCVKELNLTYMKGSYAHCGFPEIAYGRFADQLVQRGYKVGRVEQTETPQQMEERKKATPSSKPKPKVVRREVCQGDTAQSQDSFGSRAHSKFLMALCERPLDNQAATYGVCFVDVAVGKFQIGQFDDDFQRSGLRTLLAHYPPIQLLYERGKVSGETQSVLRSSLAGQVLKEGLASKTQFWSARKTLEELTTSNYFGKRPLPGSDGPREETWPENLLLFLNTADPLRATPARGAELAVMSLGAVIWYLRDCLIDVDLLSMKNIVPYIPQRQKTLMNDDWWEKQKMVLDGITLRNLDVIPADEGTDGDSWRGTLLDRLDYCSTPFGKRLLRQWICAPLCDLGEIGRRQEAVKELLNDHSAFVQQASQLLRGMPDLERLLQRIHTLGSKHRSQTHPDGRAVMFEADKYNKRKIYELLSVLSGFRAANQLHKIYNAQVRACSKSMILRQCLCSEDGGLFPEIFQDLEQLSSSFNPEKAKKDGVIIPEPGFVDSYDSAIESVHKLNQELESYLKEQRRTFGCSSIKYVGTGRNRFQLEMPDSVAKKVTSDYEVVSQRKGFKRYMTQDIEVLFSELQKAEEAREAAVKDNMRSIFELFDSKYTKWKQALECVAVFDVLLGFASYAGSLEGDMCLPEFLAPTPTVTPFLEIEEGVHPCFGGSLASGSFIPNDTKIGGEESPGSLLLITGPNMGGKSTLMRQVSLIVIVAQLGSYVPARKCRLTPVDRIFTRLGASDRITAGQSTFCVELTETNVILGEATRHSLVILDELGRGTSTHDGTAIAFAVVKDLAERVECRALFSTHYHSLVEDFRMSSAVSSQHMACMVENENEEDPTEETITFLYKLLDGPCPKSYGFHAAKLAGIPLEVIRKAHAKSSELDDCTAKDLATVKELKSQSELLSDIELISLAKRLLMI